MADYQGQSSNDAANKASIRTTYFFWIVASPFAPSPLSFLGAWWPSLLFHSSTPILRLYLLAGTTANTLHHAGQPRSPGTPTPTRTIPRSHNGASPRTPPPASNPRRSPRWSWPPTSWPCDPPVSKCQARRQPRCTSGACGATTT